MMGMPCIKVGGKMIIGIWEEEMVFKLPDEPVREQALALDGAHLFAPGERRPGLQGVGPGAGRSHERLAEVRG